MSGKAPSWVSRIEAEDQNTKRLIFEFPFLYIMPCLDPEHPSKKTADKGRIFSETDLPGFTPTQARTANDPVEGFAADSIDLIVYGQRERWRERNDEKAPYTLKRTSETQISQVQMMAGILSADDKPLTVTLTAKSTKSTSLRQLMSLANRASTSGKVETSVLAPTYNWRLRASVGPPQKRTATKGKETFEWTIHPWVFAKATDTPLDLASYAVDEATYTFARGVWRNAGQDWIESWRDPEPDELLERVAVADDLDLDPETEANMRDQAAALAQMEKLQRDIAALDLQLKGGLTDAARRKATAKRAELDEQLQIAREAF